MKRLATTLCVLFITLTLSAQKVSPDFMDGMIYFQLNTNYPLKNLNWDENDRLLGNEFPFFTEVFRKYGVNNVLRPFHLFGDEALLRIVELHFDRAQAVDSLIAELQQNEWVSYAEKVPLMRTTYKPNDPYYAGGSMNWKWYLDMIKADSAWNIQRGNANIKVAIVDNFVWGEHPDLLIDSANLCTVSYKNYRYQYLVGTATPPSSVHQGSNDDAYSASHGTHCAGLVGAISNNGKGIASIGSGVTLMGVAAGSHIYLDQISYTLQAVQWAAEHGAHVISMSLGSSASSQTQTSIMQTCYNNGIVLVAAAGNNGDKLNELSYPAALPTVISVASVDGDGKLSYFSEWGAGRADIAAPGGYIMSSSGKVFYPNILSTTYCLSYKMKEYGLSNTYYDGMQGTSMACPIVSGLVGLMLSQDSTLSPLAVKRRLQSTATPLSSASAHTIDGYGYINAYKALKDEYLMIFPDSLYFPNAKGVQDSVTVIASKSWTLKDLPTWLSASKLKGDSGKTLVVFTTLAENNDSTFRVCSLKFEGDGKAGSQVLTVTQHNFPYIFNIDKKKVRFSSLKGQYDTLRVSARCAWSMQNTASWLATDIQKVSDETSMVVLGVRSNNNTSSNRAAMLIFTSDCMPNDTVYVVQHKPDFITLSAETLSMDAHGGDTVSVCVYSNVRWKLSGGDSAWICPDKTDAEDTSRIVFTALSDNTTGDFRTADFSVSDGKITKNFSVKQLHNVCVVEYEEDAWMCAPNPTEGKLSCRFPQAVHSVLRVYDAQGRLLKSQHVEGSEVVLDLSGLAPGVYLIKYENSTCRVMKK